MLPSPELQVVLKRHCCNCTNYQPHLQKILPFLSKYRSSSLNSWNGLIRDCWRVRISHTTYHFVYVESHFNQCFGKLVFVKLFVSIVVHILKSSSHTANTECPSCFKSLPNSVQQLILRDAHTSCWLCHVERKIFTCGSQTVSQSSCRWLINLHKRKQWVEWDEREIAHTSSMTAIFGLCLTQLDFQVFKLNMKQLCSFFWSPPPPPTRLSRCWSGCCFLKT